MILAGGLGRRMGGEDKGLVTLRGQPMIRHVIQALEPQVDELLISANRNREQYAAFGHPVIIDDMEGFQGPLAGILTAMRRTRHPLLLVVPCDAPLLPADFVTRLHDMLEYENADIAVSFDGERLQPVHALLSCHLKEDLEDFLASGERKIDRWYARHHMVRVDFSRHPEIFFNVNTPNQLERLERVEMVK